MFAIAMKQITFIGLLPAKTVCLRRLLAQHVLAT